VFESDGTLLVTHLYDEKGASENLFKMNCGALEFYVVTSLDEDLYSLYYADYFSSYIEDMHDMVRSWFDLD
tara:strand:+ start:3979 stop:4191 length:213 start_codon:yes stop_codon:yes gene_type:complete